MTGKDGPVSRLVGRDLPAISKLAERFCLRLVVLFGSIARGQTHPGSDVDIAVFRGGVPLDAATVTELETALMNVLGTEAVDVVSLDGANPLLKRSVAQEGIVLFEREPGDYDQFVVRAAKEFGDTAKLRRYNEDFLTESLARLS